MKLFSRKCSCLLCSVVVIIRLLLNCLSGEMCLCSDGMLKYEWLRMFLKMCLVMV